MGRLSDSQQAMVDLFERHVQAELERMAMRNPKTARIHHFLRHPGFPVDIRLNSQQLRLKSGATLPLQVGMSLTANVKLRKVTYLQLLLSDFKDKAKSLQRI